MNTVYIVNDYLYFRSEDDALEVALSLWEEQEYEDFAWATNKYGDPIDVAIDFALSHTKSYATQGKYFFTVKKQEVI